MKRKIIIATTLCLGLSALYFYCPRKVSFELATEITKPSEEFDNSQYRSFDYVEDEGQLLFSLVAFFSSFDDPKLQGFDSLQVSNLAKNLNFKKFDYLVAYQKRIKELRHSPYLTKTEDGLYYDKQIPLIPTWDSEITDQIYIYRIKKNRRFRAPGP